MSDCKCRKQITLEKGPKAIGPYSLGIKALRFVYTAGQLGIDPVTGNLVDGGVEAQTRQALMNLEHILKAGGSGFDHVVKTTVFLKDISDFAKMNAVYAEFFTDVPPARSAVQVAALPKDALVEIEAVALVCGDECENHDSHQQEDKKNSCCCQ